MPLQNTEVEMAKQDPGPRSPGADRNPQHQRHIEINQATCEDLAQDRLAWRKSAAMNEANRIAAAKAKRAAHKSQAPHINIANVNAPSASELV
ncbi:unnamed protein product [Schistocephalus solidus]|uniref:Uncharacterized protein n=1 Tax=Schistocephalus solidus TaxID=70667 RepID=A0A183SDB1_SCHSO|nr:unnamed protein product [Schistocephalus solidus]